MNSLDLLQPSVRLTRTDYRLLLLLVLGTIALYWQTRSFEFIPFDDPLYVYQNSHILSGINGASLRYAMTAVIASNWTPLVYLVELIAVQFFGSSAAVFHTVCALFHVVNVTLLYYFLRKTTGVTWRSFIVATLWGWHPLRAESVAWVGELRDVLCGICWLATMVAYAGFRRQSTVLSYLIILLFGAMAMLAKPMAVTLGPALLLLCYWPLRNPDELPNLRYWKRRIIELIPLMLLCAGISAIAVRTQSESGMVGSLSTFPMPLRITNAVYSYLRYISKEFVPVHLGLIYPHPGMLGQTIPAFEWASAAFVLLVITIAVWRYRRTKPYLLVGWFWFVGTMVPVIGLVQLGEAAMADRYTYIPGIGFTAAVIWLIADWAAATSSLRILAGSAGALIGILFFAFSAKQISYWKTSHTLMLHSAEVIPDDFLAHGSLSMDATFAGDIPEALRQAQIAIALVPTNEEAHHALAMALQADGKLDEALHEYAMAIKLDPTDPGVRVDAGRLLATQNKQAGAIAQFQRAIELAPDVAYVHSFLATSLATQGNYDRAIAEWQIAITLNPKLGYAHGLLADALRIRGDRVGAVEHYQAALDAGESNPDWKANLVWEMAIDPACTSQQLQSILPIAKQACDQTDLKSPFPLYAYSLALARLGRFDDAVTSADAALQLAEDSHQTGLANAIKARLVAYRKGNVVVPP